jgi:Protein of unknown function (DUF3147)
LDPIIRFVVGGLVVSAFAVMGSLFKPASFAGLFGAAPSVALATITLAVLKSGRTYAAVESRSMLAGAVAMGVAAWIVCQLMMRRNIRALPATLCAIAAWFAVAFGLWAAFLTRIK